MAIDRRAVDLSERQYVEIERAVMETERGRTFLREFLKRNRHSDTMMLLEAISRLESVLCLQTIERKGVDVTTAALADIVNAVAVTRSKIAALRKDQVSGVGAAPPGSETFSTVVHEASEFSLRFLTQIERLGNLARKIREQGAPDDVCDTLEACVEMLMVLCRRQDLNGRCAATALKTLRFIHRRTGEDFVGAANGEASDESAHDGLATLPAPSAAGAGEETTSASAGPDADAEDESFASDSIVFSAKRLGEDSIVTEATAAETDSEEEGTLPEPVNSSGRDEEGESAETSEAVPEEPFFTGTDMPGESEESVVNADPESADADESVDHGENEDDHIVIIRIPSGNDVGWSPEPPNGGKPEETRVVMIASRQADATRAVNCQ